MKARPLDVVIYHKPACGTSRNTLALTRNAGVEPHVIEYLKTPPSRAMVVDLVKRMGVPLRHVLREKGTPFGELGLGDTSLSDNALLDAIEAQRCPSRARGPGRQVRYVSCAKVCSAV